MKQNSLKLIKKRLNHLKLKKYIYKMLLLNVLKSNSINITLRYKKFYYLKLSSNLLKLKKICHINGKSKAINKELKISRTSINNILIDNQLNFFKKINNNFN